jgi:plasmid stability protein
MPTATTIAVTVRKIPVETHNALKRRAAENGRSTESEIRAILDEAVMPKERLKLGSAIRALVMRHLVMRHGGGYDLQIERDQTPAGSVSFE